MSIRLRKQCPRHLPETVWTDRLESLFYLLGGLSESKRYELCRNNSNGSVVHDDGYNKYTKA